MYNHFDINFPGLKYYIELPSIMFQIIFNNIIHNY